MATSSYRLLGHLFKPTFVKTFKEFGSYTLGLLRDFVIHFNNTILSTAAIINTGYLVQHMIISTETWLMRQDSVIPSHRRPTTTTAVNVRDKGVSSSQHVMCQSTVVSDSVCLADPVSNPSTHFSFFSLASNVSFWCNYKIATKLDWLCPDCLLSV